MDRPVVSGVAHDLSGATFAVVGISTMPTDWAQVFRSLANADLTPAPLTGAAPPAQGVTPPSPGVTPSPGTTPPSVLDLNAYLMYSVGRAARRRLAEKLEARGLRLWHLTVMTLLAELGPQMKTALATRLAINPSDLVKIVDDLVRLGHAHCVRDRADRRRVVVRLTPEGEAALRSLSAEIASTDDEILAPLDAGEREQLASLLRRVHGHLERAPAEQARRRP
ncbi:MarR family transcriptional regulator [Streptomyces exfoliatus]|uniref:MarR family winged helix-turn-helix transcriptional regulator n=1 Tax=Streptomyces exfoliatus TaxID=1905 RepID=UPI003C2D81CB